MANRVFFVREIIATAESPLKFSISEWLPHIEGFCCSPRKRLSSSCRFEKTRIVNFKQPSLLLFIYLLLNMIKMPLCGSEGMSVYIYVYISCITGTD